MKFIGLAFLMVLVVSMAMARVIQNEALIKPLIKPMDPDRNPKLLCWGHRCAPIKPPCEIIGCDLERPSKYQKLPCLKILGCDPEKSLLGMARAKDQVSELQR